MRQNIVVALLSAVTTLLLVLVLTPKYPVYSQAAGGTATLGGEMGVATGPLQGGGSAFWIYERPTKRIAVYVLGNGGQLKLEAVRDIQYDLQAPEFPAGKHVPSIKQMKQAVAGKGGTGPTKPAPGKNKKEEEEEEAEE